MYPGKYDTKAYSHLAQNHGKLIRCAACYNDDSSTLLMIPAAVSCPSEWNQEYTGYLMTQPSVAGYYRQDFICIHKDMDGRTPPPSQSSQAYLLSPVETVPNSGFTSLYDSTKELACTVCSK